MRDEWDESVNTRMAKMQSFHGKKTRNEYLNQNQASFYWKIEYFNLKNL